MTPVSGNGARAAARFLSALFGDGTPIWLETLPNIRGHGVSHHEMTRDPVGIEKFISTWDKPNRGVFFTVSVLQPDAASRTKANVAEVRALHVDIDDKDITEPRAAVLERLNDLALPPTIIVNSGNGLHAYWALAQPVTCGFDRVEVVLRDLCDVVGGDPHCAELARLMRLVGSHNRKNGAALPVEVLDQDEQRRYHLDEIERWLAAQSPVITRCMPRVMKAPVVRMFRRLRAMRHRGVHDTAIHTTQLSVTAAALERRIPLDKVVRIVLAATKRAAYLTGSEGWEWRAEEEKIRAMCHSWLDKHPSAPPAGRERAPASAQVLLEIAQAASLFRTPDGVGYADVLLAGHRETIAVRNPHFRLWRPAIPRAHEWGADE
jgi:hypothetical protein